VGAMACSKKVQKKSAGNGIAQTASRSIELRGSHRHVNRRLVVRNARESRGEWSINRSIHAGDRFSISATNCRKLVLALAKKACRFARDPAGASSPSTNRTSFEVPKGPKNDS
jgi:hypothetical protein